MVGGLSGSFNLYFFNMSAMKDNDLKDVFIFVHIAKTAGSTLLYILEKNFRKGFLPLYSSKKDDFFSSDETRAIATIHSKVRCIASHDIVLPYKQPTDVNIRYVPFVFFRDPAERIISEYLYQKSRVIRGLVIKEAPTDSFIKWYEFQLAYGNKISNGRWTFGKNLQLYQIDQSMDIESAKRRLSEEFLFAGLTERFDESLIILKEKMKKIGVDLDVSYIKQNVTKNIVDLSRERDDIRKEYSGMLRENNRDEYEIYNFINAQLDADIEQYEGDFYLDLERHKNSLKDPFKLKGLLYKVKKRIRMMVCTYN